MNNSKKGLTKEERSKGFVRSLRLSYIHNKCGEVSTIDKPIAEILAKEPDFYTRVYCYHCKSDLPLDEFVWQDDEQVGS